MRREWRAKRRGVEHVVAKATVRQALKIGGLNRPAEWTGRSETNIIRQDQENVRSAFRCLHALRKIRRRNPCRTSNLACEWWFRPWQDLLSQRGGCQKQEQRRKAREF